MQRRGTTTMKLPRLRTKDELLKTSPEIFNKLLLGDDMSTARSTAPAAAQPGKLARPAHSATAGGRQGSPQRTASRGGQLGALTGAYDTPRGFGDEPLTVDQELAVELESVKRERNQLMDSIAHVKAAAGTAGGEAQQADIRQLLKELELKKAKLNELKGDSRRAETAIAKIRDDDTDAQRLTPDDCVEENSYIQCLHDEMCHVEEDLLEADAKNRLYGLLAERTRREHMAIDQKVRDKQECLRACGEDLANLTEHFNTTRAAKELAQKELAKVKRQVEEARHDWGRKIRERRAEANELQRRQRKEHEKEVRRREKLQEKERAERAAQAKLRMEEEAYQLQVAALAPKVEAMEASWNRLRAISGAETPEQVVDYWKGLQDKEARMRELVALAERREAACKAEVSQLLASRSTMYEAATTTTSSGGAAAAAVGAPPSPALGAAAAAAEAAAQAAEAEAAAQQEGGASGGAGLGEDEEQPSAEAAAARVLEAARRMEAAQAQFNKLRSICVAAEQGMRSLAQRLSIALEAPSALAATGAAGPADAAPGHPGPALAQVLPANLSGSWQASAGGMGSGGHGGAEGIRRSGAGSVPGHHRSANRDRGTGGTEAAGAANPLASKAQRLASGAAAVGRARGSNHLDRTGSGASHTAGLSLVPEDSAGSRSQQQQQQQQQRGSSSATSAALHVPGLAHPNGAAGATGGSGSSRPVLPSRGRNTIDDDSFFEGLPQLLADVTDKLERLLASGQGFDLAAITAAAAAGGMLGGGASSGSSSAATTARGLGSSAADATPRGAAVRSVGAGLLQAAPAAAAEAAAAHGEAAAEASTAPEASGASDGAAADRSSEAASEGVAGAADAGDSAAAAAEQADGTTAGDGLEQPAPAAEGQDEAAAGSAVDTAAQPSPQAAQPDSSATQATAGVAVAAAAAPAEAAARSAAQPAAPGASQPAPAPASASGTASQAGTGTGSAVPAASSFVATQCPTFAGSAARSSAASSIILLNQKALLKGMHRRTWVGAPWLDAVSDNLLDVKLVPSMKRKKGKRKEAATGPDLSRILGYIPPNDVPAESESDGDDGGSGGPTQAPGAGTGLADGVVDRDWIKMRAAKLTARHNAKAAAAAAGQSQTGGR